MHSAKSNQMVVSDLWKMVYIPTGHVNPQSIATEAIPNYI